MGDQQSCHTCDIRILTQSGIAQYNGSDMDKFAALTALGALAQEKRFDIYCLLLRAGSQGVPSGEIGRRLGLPTNALAFHLKELRDAGLVRGERAGNWVIYTANVTTLHELQCFLAETCSAYTGETALI